MDVIILMVWSFKDPLKKKALKLTSELIEKEDIINEPEIEICKCNNEIIWIGMKRHSFASQFQLFLRNTFFKQK